MTSNFFGMSVISQSYKSFITFRNRRISRQKLCRFCPVSIFTSLLLRLIGLRNFEFNKPHIERFYLTPITIWFKRLPGPSMSGNSRQCGCGYYALWFVYCTEYSGENVSSIPGACATRNFTYLVRGPWDKIHRA